MKEHTTLWPAFKVSLQQTRCAVLAIAMSLITLPALGDGSGLNESKERFTLTGNWLATVTRPAPLTSLLSLQTYFADTNVLEESNSTAIRSLKHGTWKKVGNREFTRSWLSFNFDASRVFTGSTKTTGRLLLSADGQTFVNLPGTTQVFDAQGNLISTTISASGAERGKRY